MASFFLHKNEFLEKQQRIRKKMGYFHLFLIVSLINCLFLLKIQSAIHLKRISNIFREIKYGKSGKENGY